jgi:hypothetical protein
VRQAARQYLVEHQEVLKEIRTKLLARAGIGAPFAALAVATIDESKATARPKPERAEGKAVLATKAA